MDPNKRAYKVLYESNYQKRLAIREALCRGQHAFTINLALFNRKNDLWEYFFYYQNDTHSNCSRGQHAKLGINSPTNIQKNTKINLKHPNMQRN